MKIRILVEKNIELDVSKERAYREHPDCVNPVKAHIKYILETDPLFKDWTVESILDYD